MSNHNREYLDLESRKSSALREISGKICGKLLSSFGVDFALPQRSYLETAMQMASKKRTIDRVWSEYHRISQDYESARARLIAIGDTPDAHHQISALSISLQHNLQMRDRLFKQHENLLSDFIHLKSKAEQMQAFIDRDTIRIMEPYIQLIDALDHLIDENAKNIEDLRSTLEASKTAYRGLLLRLEEISGAKRRDTDSFV